jgi:phage-related protein
MDDKENTVDQDRDAAIVFWEGDSLEIIRTFPKAIREDFGAEIRRLQLGERPLNSRPMRSIGPRVFELRQLDNRGWYRIIYLSQVGNRLFMLHSLVKKSAKTSRNDLRIATARLKAVNVRLQMERKNAQKSESEKGK